MNNSYSSLVCLVTSVLSFVRQFIDTNTALKIYGALTKPYFDYCSSVWDGLNITLDNKLQKLQNRAAKVITESRYDASANDLFSKLGCDSLSIRRKKHKATLMFKTINELTPPYLHHLFKSCSAEYNLRNSEKTLYVPKPRTNYRK